MGQSTVQAHLHGKHWVAVTGKPLAATTCGRLMVMVAEVLEPAIRMTDGYPIAAQTAETMGVEGFQETGVMTTYDPPVSSSQIGPSSRHNSSRKSRKRQHLWTWGLPQLRNQFWTLVHGPGSTPSPGKRRCFALSAL